MRTQQILLPLFVVVAGIGVVHHFAIIHFWYWTIWWVDIPMHVLGGFALGLGVLWVLALFPSFEKHSSVSLFLITLSAVILAGIGWEVFEFLGGLFVEGRFFPDTAHDIFSDIAGGLTALVYHHMLQSHNNVHAQ